MIADAKIGVDDPRKPDVRALLGRHLEFTRAQTPPQHSFALGWDGLLDPAITLFTLRAGGSLLGVGALKCLDPDHAEVKSMHTAEAMRGRGVGRAMLAHLVATARGRGFRRLSLETGTSAGYAPARALYEAAGFVPCGPFADYLPSQYNLFMTVDLGAPL